jgi:hypothetical protein
MKETWESWRRELLPDDDVEFYRKRWQSDFVPNVLSSTDSNGVAIIVMEFTVLIGHSEKNSIPASLGMKGREYSIQVITNRAEENFRLEMKPGEKVVGESFTLEVEALRDIVYD